MPRLAGQHASERARLLAVRGLLWMVVLFVSAMVAGIAFGFFSMPFLAVEWLCLGGMFLVDRRGDIIDRWQRGADGEALVGNVIEGMHEDGWRVLHDVSFGAANIDHVLLGPAGVFTVETKSHPGRIPVDRIDKWMLKQAYAEKKKLEVITGLSVEALLVFSRAYLVGGVPSKHEGVMVLPARMLAKHLKRRKTLYTADQVQGLHLRLAQAIVSANDS